MPAAVNERKSLPDLLWDEDMTEWVCPNYMCQWRCAV